MPFYKIVLYFLLVLLFSACTEQQETIPPSNPSLIKNAVVAPVATIQDDPIYRFRYDINSPNHKANLPSELIEISALTYNLANETLFAVNDELGVLYNLNPISGKVLNKSKFAGSGDYEGVEMVKDAIYVLKANGRITFIDAKSKKAKEVYKTPLSTVNDVEGLAYDPSTHSLILACKGAPELKNNSNLKNAKAFYTFDLKNKKLITEPTFIIKDKELERFLEEMSFENVSKKDKSKLKNRITSFSPSAIAVHPKSGHYYILSSVGKSLVVCNENGLILDVHFLNKKMFTQPEGICFAPDGTMYISNEGKSLIANVLTFNYK